MATYEEIYGKRVKEFDSDPTLESSYEGQVWYDKSTGVLKSVISFGAWRSGGNLTVPRTLAGISGGTQTASLAYAGYLGGPGNSNSTEEYNGTGWGSGGNVNTARRGGAGVGVQTAALLCGGYSTTPTTFVEEYDGTSWSEETNIPTDLGAGAGTQTAALIFTGTTSVSYNGTSWTASTSLPTAMTGGTGLQTAALAVIPPPSGSTTLEWNGSSWTTGGSYNTARPSGLGGMTSGIQTSAISAGTVASPPPARVGGITEQYDGTSWATSSGTQGTARNSYMTSAATNTAALIAGGAPYTTATEEFDQSINTITPAAWSSGGNLNQARGSLSGSSGAGTETAGVITTGNLDSTTVSSNTEEYDGTSWTEVTNYPTGTQWLTGVGTQTAGLFFGGQQGTNSTGGSNTTLTTEYDGSSFSTGGALGTARRILGACGTQTAAIASNGSPRTNVSQSYDGSSWTTLPNTNATCEGRGSAGAASSTAALVFGGSEPSPGKEVEEYNGSSWSEQNNLVDDRRYFSGFGTQTNALGCAGYDQEATTNLGTCTRYDGTSWATDATLTGTIRAQIGALSGSPATGGVVAGGYGPSGVLNATEEYNAETSVITSKTLTSS